MGIHPEEVQIADAQLLDAVARGDERALASLFDRYNSLLLGFLIRILNSQTEAEDVLQEVFLQVWQQAARYDETRGRVFTWLVTITRSRALDRLRTRRSTARTLAETYYERTESVSDGVEDAIKSEQGEIVRRALDKLSEAQRQALLLAYFEGLSQAEIAARLGKPIGTIKTRTRDGLGKLRKLLGKTLGEKP